MIRRPFRHGALVAARLLMLIVCVASATLLIATPVAAQDPPQPTAVPPPPGPEFLSRYDFHLTAASLAISDVRFSWDTHFGGTVDLADYLVGRTSIAVDYEAVLGNEFRAFDPNQGNYTLEVASSARVGRSAELAGMFHHVSRHLSDRPKRFAIAWNVAGARFLYQARTTRATYDVDLEGGKIVQHSNVDYNWIGELRLQARRTLTQRAAVFGRASGELVSVTGDSTRGSQRGGLLEAGIRLAGRAGALELFVGLERRIDADPIDMQPQNWALAGFRLLSR